MMLSDYWRAERLAYLRFALELRRFLRVLRAVGFSASECWPTEYLYGRQRANARSMRERERRAAA